ncbi:ABC transporter permease [Pseudomonas putida]
MRKALFGESLLAGGVIVLLAIMADRSSKAMVRIAQGRRGLPDWKIYLSLAAATGLAVTLAATYWPALWHLPALYTIAPGKVVDTALAGVVSEIGPLASELKKAAMFYVLIPVRSGLDEAMSPFSWGMELTPVLATTYWVVLALFSGVAWLRGQRWAAIAGLSLGLLYFFGFTGLPWPSLIFFAVLAALQTGGMQPALFCAAGLCFVLLSGMWGGAMVSLYLAFVGVLISAILGGALGFMAAHSGVFSRVMSPILDTLQTMPQFVFLIPALILFQLGDFSAIIAVVLYSVVPMIRYVEHGLRSVPPEIIEATEMSGASRWQVLVYAKLPSAFPQLMLGLNQTVMSALSMMVIATLVGTAGLGQEIYSALSRADVGRGLVAGLCIALIAMVLDTILRGAAQDPMSSVRR